jgi:tagatose 6-phosphate kinase
MILTVTLNLAIDVTYRVPRVRLGRTNAVRPPGRRAGGKGVNVARTLHALGHEVIVTGLAGGLAGASARAELAASGLTDATIEIAGESRTTLVVVDDHGVVTGFSEPGPEVSAEEWARLVAAFRRLVGGASAVVVSGSAPPGVPRDAYAQLTRIATDARVPVVLDSSGEPLVRGIEARPAIVKVNADELNEVVDAGDLVSGAAQLRERGAGAAVISSGPDGLVAVTEDGAWRAAPPEPLVGNPTGAGDAASAALAAGLVERTPWPERLVDAAALSAAAVSAPLAGSFDEPTYRRLRREIMAEEVGRP